MEAHNVNLAAKVDFDEEKDKFLAIILSTGNSDEISKMSSYACSGTFWHTISEHFSETTPDPNLGAGVGRP